MADPMSTPINKISRENLTVLIANNVLNSSIEFVSDCDMMETDSPIRKPSGQPISKKLFHSPMAESPNEPTFRTGERTRKAKKRKQILIPDNSEGIKRAYVKECDKDGYSPDARGGMRKKVLISLFHNKEYSMDFGA
ncbi:uncharacterized protein LOC113496022 [Trichoplusia ni]|uniref:Uncharacterized protein LOC113496022 n=1 Tax=Trichoplusia ni TaxID=7111 RepID=A0A7E5VRV8_TRINI|nr:uncharacterized protein LOC113496022 [Trichoplusia ni]